MSPSSADMCVHVKRRPHPLGQKSPFASSFSIVTQRRRLVQFRQIESFQSFKVRPHDTHPTHILSNQISHLLVRPIYTPATWPALGSQSHPVNLHQNQPVIMLEVYRMLLSDHGGHLPDDIISAHGMMVSDRGANRKLSRETEISESAYVHWQCRSPIGRQNLTAEPGYRLCPHRPSATTTKACRH